MVSGAGTEGGWVAGECGCLDDLVDTVSQRGHAGGEETDVVVPVAVTDYLKRYQRTAGFTANRLAVVEIGFHQSVPLPAQRIEDEHSRCGDMDAVGQLTERAVDDGFEILAGAAGVIVLGTELTHALLAARAGVAGPGCEGVFGVEGQILPEVADLRTRSGQVGVEEGGQGGEFFGRTGALLQSAVECDKTGIGSQPVFPVGAKAAADGLQLRPEVLIDVVKVVREGGQFHHRIRVGLVPLPHELRFAGDEVGIFDLASVEQHRVRLVPRRLILLEEGGQRLPAGGHLVRNFADEGELEVLAGIRHQHFAPVRTLPPEGGLCVPSAVHQDGGAVIVAGRGEVLDAQ